MAVPPEFTLLDISGKFIINKSLSDTDKMDQILSLQGVGWLKRKAIGAATVTLNVKHYKNDDGKECIDIDQTLTGGIPGTREERILDNTERAKEDSLFGAVIAKSRRVVIADIEESNAFLADDWVPAAVEQGLIQAIASSDTPKSGTTWRGNQTWGVEEVQGEKRYARHVYFVGPKEEITPPPLLDIDITIKGRHFVAPIESTFIRRTRFLTSPWLFCILVVGYVIGLSFLTRAQWFLIPSESFITCTSTYWLANGGCGLDGSDCAPFDNSSFEFRCPAQCQSVTLANPRSVGDERPVFVPLIVGGGDANRTYRADSFICAAAIQAGIISNSKGGCATLVQTGNFTNYLPFTQNGLTSVGFPTVFPSSYHFDPTTSLKHCEDIRDPVLAFNVIATCILFLLLRPKPIVLYWCMICIGYWHIFFWSQPRSSPPPISDGFGDFLPTLFIAYGLWRCAIRFTWPVFQKAPIESAIWFLATFWTGVLANVTLDKIPIDRLIASDLRKRAGAISSLIIIILVVLVAVLNQARIMRKTGWIFFYAKWYIFGGLIVLILALLPGFQIRLHHYIIGIILLPVTAFPTRPSLIYQGFLLGLFLQGDAGYSLDSILQTLDELRRDDIFGSTIPTFVTNSTNWNTTRALAEQFVFWEELSGDWDGFSVLVDDVERYVGTATNLSMAAFAAGVPHFIRIAFTSTSQPGDYTMPAIIWPNGTWQEPEPGST
ncbi:hypothetical protein DL96DRAFT_1732991 [Flagelloscypha sp. PMI_526]|nr:hypothetical protein DL96DRAFT_1732991 [Flagelloscypha sp. PMI_526]